MEYESGLAEHERLKLFSRKKYVLQGLLMDYINDSNMLYFLTWRSRFYELRGAVE